MEKYDVIIVGAGPVGLMTAKLLNSSGLNILLVDKRKNIRKVDNNILATFRDTIDRFKLGGFVIQDYPHVRLYGPGKSVGFNFKEKPLAVVDFSKWAGKLKLKCEIKTSTRIVSAKREKEGISVVDSKKNKYTGKIVVDCSGNSQIVSSKLKIPKSRVFCACYIVGLENCNIPDPKESSLAGDLRFANAGGWVYPFSRSKCQFGISDYRPYKTPYKKNLKKRAFEMMKKFKPYSDWLKGSKVVFEFYKEAPPLMPIKHMAMDNFISVGDAAGQGTPFLGDCIRPGLEMAELAAKVIKKAFRKMDFSHKTLGEFEDDWHEKYGWAYLWSILIRHIWACEFSNKDIIEIVENIKKMPKRDFYKFIRSDIHFEMFAGLIDLKIWGDVILNFINNHMPHLPKRRSK